MSKPKTLFDHVNAIYQNQSVTYYDELDDVDKKTFNVYMINRFISMNMNYVEIVNELQKYYESTTPRSQYLFYSQLLPRGRQFNKYIKAGKKEKIEDWAIDVLVLYYNVSKSEALTYLDILKSFDVGKEWLNSIAKLYGKKERLK